MKVNKLFLSVIISGIMFSSVNSYAAETETTCYTIAQDVVMDHYNDLGADPKTALKRFKERMKESEYTCKDVVTFLTAANKKGIKKDDSSTILKRLINDARNDAKETFAQDNKYDTYLDTLLYLEVMEKSIPYAQSLIN